MQAQSNQNGMTIACHGLCTTSPCSLSCTTSCAFDANSGFNTLKVPSVTMNGPSVQLNTSRLPDCLIVRVTDLFEPSVVFIVTVCSLSMLSFTSLVNVTLPALLPSNVAVMC